MAKAKTKQTSKSSKTHKAATGKAKKPASAAKGIRRTEATLSGDALAMLLLSSAGGIALGSMIGNMWAGVALGVGVGSAVAAAMSLSKTKL